MASVFVALAADGEEEVTFGGLALPCAAGTVNRGLSRKLTGGIIWGAPNVVKVNFVTSLPDGTIAGVGTDQQVYIRPNVDSNRSLVPNAWGITSLAVLPDGRFAGIGTDNQVYTRVALNNNWAVVPNS